MREDASQLHLGLVFCNRSKQRNRLCQTERANIRVLFFRCRSALQTLFPCQVYFCRVMESAYPATHALLRCQSNPLSLIRLIGNAARNSLFCGPFTRRKPVSCLISWTQECLAGNSRETVLAALAAEKSMQYRRSVRGHRRATVRLGTRKPAKLRRFLGAANALVLSI
jgi:hypothetical protein